MGSYCGQTKRNSINFCVKYIFPHLNRAHFYLMGSVEHISILKLVSTFFLGWFAMRLNND